MTQVSEQHGELGSEAPWEQEEKHGLAQCCLQKIYFIIMVGRMEELI